MTLKEELRGYFKYNQNKNPLCPFCDKEIDIHEYDLQHLEQEDEHFIDCPFCNKEISVYSSASWTFTTGKPENI
jgi:uncharacterized Zn-finger protein